VAGLLKKVGETATVEDLQTTSIDAELAAAKARECELRQEIADLASGRRLAISSVNAVRTTGRTSG
jgi:hypothetical protein